MCMNAASETSTSSQVSKQEHDIRRQRHQLDAKDPVAEAMIALLVVTVIVTFEQLLAAD